MRRRTVGSPLSRSRTDPTARRVACHPIEAQPMRRHCAGTKPRWLRVFGARDFDQASRSTRCGRVGGCHRGAAAAKCPSQGSGVRVPTKGLGGDRADGARRAGRFDGVVLTQCAGGSAFATAAGSGSRYTAGRRASRHREAGRRTAGRRAIKRRAIERRAIAVGAVQRLAGRPTVEQSSGAGDRVSELARARPDLQPCSGIG